MRQLNSRSAITLISLCIALVMTTVVILQGHETRPCSEESRRRMLTAGTQHSAGVVVNAVCEGMVMAIVYTTDVTSVHKEVLVLRDAFSSGVVVVYASEPHLHPKEGLVLHE